VGAQAWQGWKAIRVTRGVERVPSDFDLAVTEEFPGQAARIDVQPGQACQIKIGGDIAVTGWINRYVGADGPQASDVRIMGRSLCQDLVDCSALVAGSQISGASALSLAQQLAAPFNVTVTALSGAGPVIPQFNVNLGESPFEIIERVARYAGFLVYDGPDGNLVLSQVGQQQHASGFVEGQNVQASSASFADDQRFSHYYAAVMSVDRLQDLGTGGNLIGLVTDTTVARYRPRVIVSSQMINGRHLAIALANWEKARRIGRSQAVSLTADSWRDRAGTLWTPNANAPVWLPARKLTPSVPWVIAEVSYILDAERGTVADLTLMPPEAFTPAPSTLQLFDWQIGQALQSNPPPGP
jgi:prophage tail gpP-like protein